MHKNLRKLSLKPAKYRRKPRTKRTPLFLRNKGAFLRGQIANLVQKKIPRFLPLLGGLLILVVAIKLYLATILWLSEQGLNRNLFQSLLANKPAAIVRSYQGRTNIVALGIAGTDLPGGDLTDTMLFLSVDLTKPDVVLTSLPRDIWSPTLQDKINSAYHYGEKKKPEGGFVLAKSIVEEITGQPVHYAFLVDFTGFQAAINTVGGVTVEVPEEFVDKKFPVLGRENDDCDGDPDFTCRFETVSFHKGKQVMDGDLALKYVRSRNAEGRQGTDFARSQRQQQIILAFKDKLIDWHTLINPFKLKQLYHQLTASIKTDARLSEILVLAKLTYRLERASLRKIILDAGDKEQGRTGWLYNPPLARYNRWVLLPQGDSFPSLHKLISCHLESSTCNLQPEDN